MPEPASSIAPSAPPATGLPPWRRPLAVVAHPDDESFGLGAILSSFVEQGAEPDVLCFTRGEASTLHGVDGDLGEIRAAELAAAAALLGIAHVDLRDEPDGALGADDPGRLCAAVVAVANSRASDGLLVFDPNGVTGHPDHMAATAAAVAAAREVGLPVLAWALPVDVTAALVEEFAAPFSGRPRGEIDIEQPVDRSRQLSAVNAHPSQAVPGSVLWRRLELLADVEHLMWLHRP